MGLFQQRPQLSIIFYYNEKSGYDSEYVGVFAQALQDVAPYMVSTNRENGYLNVDNSAMTYMLINAVKELSKENSSLEQRLDQQQVMIEQLQEQMALLNGNSAPGNIPITD